VVDKAVAPEQKSGPRRLLIVSVTTVLAFFFTCLWMVLAEAAKRKLEDPEARARWGRLRQLLGLSSANS